jgi:hypothetical protein
VTHPRWERNVKEKILLHLIRPTVSIAVILPEQNIDPGTYNFIKNENTITYSA